MINVLDIYSQGTWERDMNYSNDMRAQSGIFARWSLKSDNPEVRRQVGDRQLISMLLRRDIGSGDASEELGTLVEIMDYITPREVNNSDDRRTDVSNVIETKSYLAARKLGLPEDFVAVAKEYGLAYRAPAGFRSETFEDVQ